METSANRKRRSAPIFSLGQKVWLSRRHVGSTRPSSKLNVRRLGPFPVIGQIGTSSYRLELPSTLKIHPVFHVSLLEPHNPNTFPGRVVAPPPPPVVVDGAPEHEVATVLDSKIVRGHLFYLVDWVGYDESERSWERADNMDNVADAVVYFHATFPDRPSPPPSSRSAP